MLSISDYCDVGMNLLKIKFLRRLNVALPPRVIAYTVTWRCNAACNMCGTINVTQAFKNSKDELCAKEISEIFKDPLLRKLDLIRFTGGEPFLKEDFINIVEEIIKNTKTKIYYITSNGYFSQKIFELVRRVAPQTANLVIQISLDAIGRVHDEIRRLEGLYDKAMDTLKGLKNLKEKYKFSFGVNQTITPQTINYLSEIRDLCYRFKCDHKIYLAQETHESDILEGDNLSPKTVLISNPNKETIKNLFSQIEFYYKQKETQKKDKMSLPESVWDFIERSILLGSKNRLLKGYDYPNPPCLALFSYLRLLPDGSVMPCTLKPKSIGNLKEHTFTEIWNSEDAKKLRSEIRSCKGCWIECDIVPNIIYSFDTARRVLINYF